MMEVANHPECRPELEREARAFFADRNFEKLNAAPWHGAVLDEVMRLWPPVWVFMRQAETEDKLGDVVVPPGANVVLAPFLSHRAADLWEAPLEFCPARFLPEEKKKIPAGAFYPFGFGPRACIGAYFAGLEARIILASLVNHFDWDIVRREPQRNEAGISLRPRNNTVMKFRRRE
jgi:cytochrome P450